MKGEGWNATACADLGGAHSSSLLLFFGQVCLKETLWQQSTVDLRIKIIAATTFWKTFTIPEEVIGRIIGRVCEKLSFFIVVS